MWTSDTRYRVNALPRSSIISTRSTSLKGIILKAYPKESMTRVTDPRLPQRFWAKVDQTLLEDLQ